METLRIFSIFLLIGIAKGIQFSTQEQDVAVLEGDSVTLNCGVLGDPDENLILWTYIPFDSDASKTATLTMDGNILEWRDIIEVDTMSVDGARTRNLIINDLTVDQEGSYVCKVTGGSGLAQINKVTVNIPPTVTMEPDGPIQEYMLGDAAAITCNAEGKPAPTVTWGRLTPEFILPDGSESFEGETYIIEELSAYDAGTYECTAQNDAGAESKTVQIEVRYAPNVTVEEEAIHTGPGDDLSITCRFLASPEADVTWYHNGAELDNSDGMRNIAFGTEREEFEDSFTLRIDGVQESDLGEYECFGENKYGEASGIVQLSAHPHSLSIVSRRKAKYSDQYKLKWEVVSFPEISQYELLVEQVNDTTSWTFANHTLSGKGTSGSDVQARAEGHLLEGLTANTTYQVKLRAVNAFGETEWEEFEFHTADEGNTAPPPTTLPPTTQPLPTETQPQFGGNGGSTESESTSSANQLVASVITIATIVFALLS